MPTNYSEFYITSLVCICVHPPHAHCSIVPPVSKTPSACFVTCHASIVFSQFNYTHCLWCLVAPTDVEPDRPHITTNHLSFSKGAAKKRTNWKSLNSMRHHKWDPSDISDLSFFNSTNFLHSISFLSPFALSVSVMFHMCCICIFMRWQLTWTTNTIKVLRNYALY